MKKILPVLVLTLLSFKTHAYTFTDDFAAGFYWGELPVKIAVKDESPKEVDRLEGYLAHAVNMWNADQEVDAFEVDYSGRSQNVLRWSNDFERETGYPGKTTLAVTFRYRSGANFVRTEIILNKAHYQLITNQNNLLGQTILHEVAHTVGLGHTDQNGIMAPMIGNYNVTYSDDIDGLKAVIDTTLERQSTNYIPTGAYSEAGGGAGCGGSSSAGSTGMASSFIVSFLMGLLPFGLKKLTAKSSK